MAEALAHMSFGGKTVQWPETTQEWVIWVLLLIGIFFFMRAAAGPSMAVLATATGVAGFAVDSHFFVQYGLLLVAFLAYVFRAQRTTDLTPRRVAREGAFIGGGFFLYELGRLIFEGDPATAQRNATRVVALERRFGGAFEGSWQQTMLGHENAVDAFNRVYSFMFIPLVIGALFWLLLFDDASYRVLRTALGISALLAVVTIALFPVAPPRYLEGFGVIDTHNLLGRRHGFINEYAAIPSLHVGWSITVGYVLCRSWRRLRWRHVAYLPGFLMAVTVVVTGNHYWLDGLVGVCFALIPAIWLSHREDLAAARRGVRWVSGWSAARAAVAENRGAQLSIGSLALLLAYLIVREPITPGFTNYWGYMIAQVAATIAAIAYLCTVFRAEGGLSWPTHVIVIVVTYADTLGTANHFYERFVTYDKITHFGGGAALAAACYDILFALNLRGRISWTPGWRVFLATLVPVALGAGWEFYEYVGDVVFNTGRHRGNLDTIYDVISDTTGALLVCLLMWRRELKQLPEFQAEPERVLGRPGMS
jgi:PAP2 superfamily